MTGLFFGSFNPIHNGHLRIAEYVLKKQFCDEIWFVISPRNPLKEQKGLLEEYKRKEIVEKALTDNAKMSACDIEFSMPKPSYTIDTLIALREKFPLKKFALIIGADNLERFHLWRDYRKIYSDYTILVYPRPDCDISGITYPNVKCVDAPLFEESSTEIRERIKRNKSVKDLVPLPALELIEKYYSEFIEERKRN